jgi:DNA-binding transcriptional MerR regulator
MALFLDIAIPFVAVANLPEYLNITQAARLLGLPRQTVRWYVARSIIVPDAWAGGRPVFDPSLRSILIALRGFKRPGDYLRLEARVLSRLSRQETPLSAAGNPTAKRGEKE